MADGIVWNDFVAFEGHLTRDILRESDIPTDLAKWTTFRNGLRANTQNYGIPVALVLGVQNLLNIFFPDGEPVRRSRTVPTGEGALRRADPVPVSFGAANPMATIGIADAPTALGYIFSVVTPSTNAPTWENYYLPLLVFFSRCMYLAFTPDGADQHVTLDVPIMSCVMYIAHGVDVGDIPPYIYGSTWVQTEVANSDRSVENLETERAIDLYRKETILEGSMGNIPTGPPQPQLPQCSPIVWQQYASSLLALVRGRWGAVPPGASQAVITQTDATTAVEATRLAIVAYYANAGPPLPPTTQMALLFGDIRTMPQMTSLAIDLLRIRIAPGYDRNGAAVRAAYKALLKWYLTPHLYELPGIGQPQVAIPDAINTTIDQSIDVLWETPAVQTKALNKLDIFYNGVTSPVPEYKWMQHRPFGRCAETYTVVGLLPNYFPHTSVPNIRGMSLETRVIGRNTQVFNTDFNSRLLDSCGGPTGPYAYRYPCENCCQLLPIFTVPVNLPPQTPGGYNSDINVVPPLPQLHPPR